jgi:hypothetical protein
MGREIRPLGKTSTEEALVALVTEGISDQFEILGRFMID